MYKVGPHRRKACDPTDCTKKNRQNEAKAKTGTVVVAVHYNQYSALLDTTSMGSTVRYSHYSSLIEYSRATAQCRIARSSMFQPVTCRHFIRTPVIAEGR